MLSVNFDERIDRPQKDADEETDGVAQETINDSLSYVASEAPVPYGFDQDDYRFSNKDVAHTVVDEQHIQVQRYVGQHIDSDGRDEHLLSPFQQEPQYPILDEDGGDERGEQLENQLRCHNPSLYIYNVASRYPGISAAASNPNANPSLPFSSIFAQ